MSATAEGAWEFCIDSFSQCWALVADDVEDSAAGDGEHPYGVVETPTLLQTIQSYSRFGISYRPSLNHKPCRLEIGGRYLYDSFSTL